MVTGNGNADPIPADLGGRVLWAAKHFGVLTVFCAFLLWYGGRLIDSQTAERKEQGMFMRETLMSFNGKVVEAITKSNAVMETHARESQLTRDAIEKNTRALDKIAMKND